MFFFYFVDNYALARLKAKKAETTSDLSTDPETNVRKRKKPQFSSSESDMSDIETPKSRKICSLPDPPKLTKDHPILHQEDNIGTLLINKQYIGIFNKFSKITGDISSNLMQKDQMYEEAGTGIILKSST